MAFFDFLKPKPRVSLDRVMPWVRARSTIHLKPEREGTQNDDALLDDIPLNDALSIRLSKMTPEGLEPLTPADMKRLAVDRNTLLVHAAQNAAACLQNVLTRDGLYIWTAEQPVAPALAFVLPSLREGLKLKGQPILMIPSDDCALVAGSEDVPALTLMLDWAEKRHSMSDNAFLFRAFLFEANDRSQTWVPDKTHPLFERFAHLECEAAIAEASEFYRLFQDRLEGCLAPLSAHVQNGRPMLTAHWIRGASVLIPAECQRIRLHDTDDASMAPVDVERSTLKRFYPLMFEDIGLDSFLSAPPDDSEEPVMYRARYGSFPTLRQLQFLSRYQPTTTAEAMPAVMLQKWDEGLPIFLEFNDETQGLLPLTLHATDGQYARVSFEQMHERILSLPKEDLSMLHAFLAVNSMWAVIMNDIPASDAEASKLMQALSERLDETDDARDAVIDGRLQDAFRDSMANREEKPPELFEVALDSFDPATLFPMLRPPDYPEGNLANLLGMLQAHVPEATLEEGSTSFVRPWEHGCTLELVCDRGNAVVPLSPSFFPKSLEKAAWNSALMNLRAQSARSLKPTSQPGVFEGPWHDSHDAARLLLQPKLFENLPVRGLPLVFAPTVNQVWVTGTEDDEGIRFVLDAMEALFSSGDTTTPYQFREILFGRPWVLLDGSATLWQIPPEHPQSALISHWEASLEARRKKSAELIGRFAQATYSGNSGSDSSTGA